MEDEQVDAYAPHMRSAASELYKREPEYYRQEDLLIKSTEDDGPWKPSEELMELVPNIENIEVELIDQTTNLDQMTEKFIAEKNVGLVLMGRNIGRHTRPAVIVLTTSDRYFAIDPNDTEIGIKFLKACVSNRNFTLWTTNGLHEADCLYHNYKIKLFNSEAKCCSGLHINLMRLIMAMPETENVSKAPLYPTTAIMLARRSRELKLETFETLVRVWLSFDDRDITFNSDQLIHLSRKPLNQTAINIIKKRCSLVLTLVEALEYFSDSELQAMNGNVLRSLICDSDTTRAYLRKVMRNNEKNQKASVLYYAHLDKDITSDPVPTG